MSVIEKWQGLWRLRNNLGAITRNMHEYKTALNEIDTDAADLEAWARSAPAGEVLDEICGRWLGKEVVDEMPPMYGSTKAPKFDTSAKFDQPCRVIEMRQDGQTLYTIDGSDTHKAWLRHAERSGKIEFAERVFWPRYSTDPAAAMELLVAMHGELLCTDGSEGANPEVFVPARPHPRNEHIHDGRVYACGPEPGTESLAIARACAILSARGIQRGDQ